MKKKSLYILNIFLFILCLGIVFYLGSRKQFTERFSSKDEKEEFENKLAEGIKQGKIDRDLISKKVKEGKISKKDIDGIISNVAEYINSQKN